MWRFRASLLRCAGSSAILILAYALILQDLNQALGALAWALRNETAAEKWFRR